MFGAVEDEIVLMLLFIEVLEIFKAVVVVVVV